MAAVVDDDDGVSSVTLQPGALRDLDIDVQVSGGMDISLGWKRVRFKIDRPSIKQFFNYK